MDRSSWCGLLGTLALCGCATLPSTKETPAPSATITEALETLFEGVNDPVSFTGFNTQEEAQAWLNYMSQRLQEKIAYKKLREEFLLSVHYEATRAGVNPGLVLALIQIASNFERDAVSKQGARGYMQVNPRWVKLIGSDKQDLFHTRTNLRYGCIILGHYLQIQSGDLRRALMSYGAEIYPDSMKDRAEFPNLVVSAWEKNWNYSKQ
jgi:soluble lytic murein transglycosylase-like protein